MYAQSIKEGNPVRIPGRAKVAKLESRPKQAKFKPLASDFKSKTPVASSGGDIETIVRQAARKYGVDEEHFVHIAKCESGLNPDSVNRNYFENGHPSGLYQHLSGYWPNRAAKYGHTGASVFDAKANAEVTAQMFRDGLTHLWECQ